MTPPRLSEQDARSCVRAALSEADGWVLILTHHAKQQMIARNVTDVRIRSVLRHGRITEGPYLDGEKWKCNFTGTAAGGVTVVVGFAFNNIDSQLTGGQAVVVTVMDLSNSVRLRLQ